MKKVFGVIVMLLFFSGQVFAQTSFFNSEKLKEFNPDGEKYEFMRDFLVSLHYLVANEERSQEVLTMDFENLDDDQKGEELIVGFIQDNVNIRIAKNMLRNYVSPKNGLMLKVTNLFTEMCDELIVVNTKARALLEEFQEIQENQEEGGFDSAAFQQKQDKLSEDRRNALKKLLEASMMAAKVIISSKTDRFGQLSVLGITREQKSKLLVKLDSFEGDGFDGDVRDGQSFLQGSVSAIREIIEDRSWGLLDD